MAKQEFLAHLRVARHLFFHMLVPKDDPSIDSQALERMMGRAALWLTPKSVEGFEGDDFPELGVACQAELAAAVREFADVASQALLADAATCDQLLRGEKTFTTILRLLQFHLPSPPEGQKLEEALKTVSFPSWIANWDYEFGSNADGEPSIRVMLFADEQVAPRAQFGRVANRLNTDILHALMAFGIVRWPYVHMRTIQEHKTLNAPAIALSGG